MNQMDSKFAKAFASNIATIAEATTRIVLIDAHIGTLSEDTACCNRAECFREVERAKSNIAQILMSPGGRFDGK